MSDRANKLISGKKGILEKVLLVVIIIMVITLSMFIVGFKNFSSNKVIYLRFGYPAMTGSKNVNITRIELLYGTESVNEVDGNNFTSLMSIRYDVAITNSSQPRESVEWNEIAFMFSERAVINRNIMNMTLLVYAFNETKDMIQLEADIEIPDLINSISINNFNITTYELEVVVTSINPILEILSFV